MLVAFDCDGTLININDDCPKYDVINIYLWFAKRGNRMIIWSGGGEIYARSIADRLGLRRDVIAFKCKESAEKLKPDITFDDEIVELGKVNIQV